MSGTGHVGGRAGRAWRRRLAPLQALLLAAIVFSLGLLAPGVAGAQGIVLPPAPCFDQPIPLPGPLPEPMPAPAPVPGPPTRLPPIPPRPIVPCWLTIRSHQVDVEIANQVATTRVDQVFVNQTGRDLEGTYVFPLPEDATVSNLAMWVDGEKIEGQVLTREEARRIYEAIVRGNRDPALLEYVGRGAFQARIFPVPAGGERRIQLAYEQVLRQESGLARYAYPFGTERFSPGRPQQTTVRVAIRSPQPLRSIYSPSHDDITVTREGDGAATITWAQTDAAPRKSFEIVYGVSPDAVGIHLLSHRPASEDGYFLLLAAPGGPLGIGASAIRAIAQDVTLVFDTSGSMAGPKIEQAKAALRYVVNRLNPEDRFNIVSFASTVDTFAGGVQGTSERGRALEYVDRLVATGGTNINDALGTALKLAADQALGSGGRPHTVIFVTDGLPTVGPQQPEQIIANVKATGGQGRLFTFGVGNDVNTTLLDKLAADFGGTSGYVKPNENLEEAISTFYAKVSTPVLTDLRLDFGGAETYDVLPSRLPDLYAGSQLVIAGRYRLPAGGPPAGGYDVTLSGTAAGQAQRFTARNITLATGPAAGQEALPRLWASRKIGFLLSEIRLRGNNPELVEEIVGLATRYGIATPYTSIFVPEPGLAAPRPALAPDALQAGGAAGSVGSNSGSLTGLLPQGTPAPVTSTQGQAGAADALSRSLAAAPASGAGAVQNSEQTRRLQEASAAPPAATERVQVVADKTFVLVDGVWTDVSAGEEPPAERVRVAFASDAYFALLDAHPEIARYLTVGPRALLNLAGTWYEIAEG